MAHCVDGRISVYERILEYGCKFDLDKRNFERLDEKKLIRSTVDEKSIFKRRNNIQNTTLTSRFDPGFLNGVQFQKIWKIRRE